MSTTINFVSRELSYSTHQSAKIKWSVGCRVVWTAGIGESMIWSLLWQHEFSIIVSAQQILSIWRFLKRIVICFTSAPPCLMDITIDKRSSPLWSFSTDCHSSWTGVIASFFQLQKKWLHYSFSRKSCHCQGNYLTNQNRMTGTTVMCYQAGARLVSWILNSFMILTRRVRWYLRNPKWNDWRDCF